MCPFSAGSWVHIEHNVACRGLPPYQVAAWCIQPFGHNKDGPENLGDCPLFWGGDLCPHLAQCGLDQGLPPRQVPSWSIQPFGHNRHGPKIGGLRVLFWEGGWVAWAEAYLHTKWHLDASSRLATIEMGRTLHFLPLLTTSTLYWITTNTCATYTTGPSCSLLRWLLTLSIYHNLGFIHIYSHTYILHIIIPFIKPLN